MREVFTVLVFALLWPVLVGELSAYNLLVGGALAVLLLSLVRSGGRSFARRMWGFSCYLGVFFWELLLANGQLTRLIFSPRPRLYPHIVAVPLRLTSDAGIALLSATITLLPGTVAMGVSSDRKKLYAHAINLANAGRARDSITQIEALILGFMK